MATGGVITNDGKNADLKRLYGTTVTAFSVGEIGIGTATPSVSDTGIQTIVPITPSLINNCATLGDWTKNADAITPTANIVTYKEGYGTSDLTSLNLGKSGTASTTMSYYCTVSLNLSTKKLFAWLWI